jgi:hypothetical protein
MLLAARIFALAAGTNGPEFTKIGICADLGTFGTTISSTGQNAAQAEKWRDPTIEFSKLINDRQSSISVAHLAIASSPLERRRVFEQVSGTG